MVKLVLLFALIIALITITSAEWEMTSPTTGEITPGSLITFSFKTDTNVAIEDPLTISLSGVFFDSTAVVGEGQGVNFCFVGTKAVATSSVSTDSLDLEFFEELDASASVPVTVTCTFRILVKPSTGSFEVDFAPRFVIAAVSKVVLTVKEAVPSVEIAAASSNDGTTEVIIQFEKLSSSLLYGPLTFGYGTTTQVVDDYIKTWMTTSDFNASIDSKVRLVTINGGIYLFTDVSAPTTASVTLQYGSWDMDHELPSEVYVTLTAYEIDVTISRAITPMSAAAASIYYEKKNVSYSMNLPQSTNENPTFKFSIDKYDTDVIFGTGATLSYSVDGGAYTPLTDKTFEHKLTATKNARIDVKGTFPVQTHELATIDASIDGQSDTDSIVVSAYPTALSIGSVTDNVLSYTYTIGSKDTDYTGSIDYDLASSISYSESGDIRAFDAYTPECTSDMTNVSVQDKITEDNFDARLIPVMTSGSLEKSSTTHTVTCTQKLHTGPKAKRLVMHLSTVGVDDNLVASKDMTWDVPETSKYNQRAEIKGEPITNQDDLTKLIDQVTALFTAEWDDDYIFHYVDSSDTTVQHYAANQAGLTLEFTNPMVEHYSKAGSFLSLAFQRSTENADPYKRTFFSDDLYVVLSGTAGTADTSGLTAPVAFVDGSSSELSTSINFGYGFTCVTSAQCASNYCLDGICSEWGQLTRSQQAAIIQSLSSSSGVFTTFALAIALVALFF